MGYRDVYMLTDGLQGFVSDDDESRRVCRQEATAMIKRLKHCNCVNWNYSIARSGRQPGV